jgi:hypothetical protein
VFDWLLFFDRINIIIFHPSKGKALSDDQANRLFIRYFSPESENDESTPAPTQHFEFPDTYDVERERLLQPEMVIN